MIPTSIRPFLTLLSLLLSTTLFIACGDDDAAEENGPDTTAVDDSAALSAPDPATVAAVDTLLSEYKGASDSLLLVFQQIKSVADAETHAAAITRLTDRIAAFNAKTAQYGQVMNDRMNGEVGAAAFANADKLIAERERLQKMPEVYAVIQKAEGRTVPGSGE